MNIIFSDGSSRPVKNQEMDMITGAGTVILLSKKKKKYEKAIPLPYKKNNYAELYSIYEGLLKIEKESSIDKDTIIIVTDSSYAITVLSDTMIYAGNNFPFKSKWYIKSGKEMAHQDLIKKIYPLITKNKELKSNIFFIHMNSHLKETADKDIKRVQHSFKKVGFKISEEDAKMAIRYNAKADILAKEAGEKLLS